MEELLVRGVNLSIECVRIARYCESVLPALLLLEVVDMMRWRPVLLGACYPTDTGFTEISGGPQVAVGLTRRKRGREKMNSSQGGRIGQT